jgi:hypothetical protein
MLRLGAGQVSLMGPGVTTTVMQPSSRSPEGGVQVGVVLTDCLITPEVTRHSAAYGA